MIKIIVDADSCPVKSIVEKLAAQYRIRLVFVANYHHEIKSHYGEVIIVDDRGQAADITIVNLCSPQDIVVTQDYGLASIVLTKGAEAIHPRGTIYEKEKMEALLLERYIKQKARQSGIRTKGPNKRRGDEDRQFENNLNDMIKRSLDKL